MGEEKRVALRKRLHIEDMIIGTFVLFALLYPIFVTVLIELEKVPADSDRLGVMRDAYLFVAGLEDCSPQVASRIVSHMERELVHSLGGVAGLINLCRHNRKNIEGTVSVRESVIGHKDTMILTAEIVIRKKGIPRWKKKVKVIASVGENIRIRDISYAEGD